MRREISFKKFLIFLSLFLIGLLVFLAILFAKTKPLCKKDGNYCSQAFCTSCVVQDDMKICTNCNVWNEKKEKIWTGGCIFDH